MSELSGTVSDLFGVKTSDQPDYNAKPIEWALWYASKGVPVFPLAHKSKVPLIPSSRGGNGVNDATTDPEQIRVWWSAHPHANIGGACGVFMDALDIEADGGKTYLQLDSKERAAVVVRTPSGGLHVWYKPNEKKLLNGVKFAPGLDWRTAGGYVVLPPSFVVEDAKGYEGWYEFVRPLNGKPLPEISDALAAAIAKAQRGNRASSAKPQTLILDGERNVSLFRYACRLRRDGMDEDEIAAATMAVNLSRCQPPLSEADVRKISASAAKYPPAEAPVTAVTAKPSPDGLSPRRKASQIKTQQVPWLLYPYLARGMLAVIEGDPGLGKSFLAGAICSAISKGLKLPFCEDPTPVGTALMYMSEDSAEYTTVPRLRQLGADLDRIELVDEAFPLNRAGLDRLRDDVLDCKPTIVILDPTRAFFDTALKVPRPEIDIEGILSGLKEIAATSGACIVILRHMRKPAIGDNNPIYSGYGDIAIIGKARTVLQIRRDPDNYKLCLVAHIKSNIGPLGQTFSYEIVPIGRDRADFYWAGMRTETATELAQPKVAEDKKAVEKARAFLVEALSGVIMLSDKVFSEGEKLGYSRRTLYRAADKIPGLKKFHNRPVYGDDRWRWTIELEGHQPTDDQGDLWDG